MDPGCKIAGDETEEAESGSRRVKELSSVLLCDSVSFVLLKDGAFTTEEADSVPM